MNTKVKKTMSWAAALAVVGGGAFAVNAQAQQLPASSGIVAADTATADAALTKQLTFMREEERMARDLYKALADKYDGAVPFSRITVSEDRHFDSVGVLLDRYDVTDPTEGLDEGEFKTGSLDEAYDGYLDEGDGLPAALKAAQEVEEADIAGLEKAAKSLDAPDAEQVYEHLTVASQHHLEVFSR